MGISKKGIADTIVCALATAISVSLYVRLLQRIRAKYVDDIIVLVKELAYFPLDTAERNDIYKTNRENKASFFAYQVICKEE